MRKLFLAVCIAFLVAACDTGNMEKETVNTVDNETSAPNRFIGTWETSADTQLPRKFVFTDSKFTGYDENGDIKSQSAPGYPDSIMTWNGTYDYNDTQITVHLISSNNISIVYEFKNNSKK